MVPQSMQAPAERVVKDLYFYLGSPQIRQSNIASISLN